MSESVTTDTWANDVAQMLEKIAGHTADSLRQGEDPKETLETAAWLHQYLSGAMAGIVQRARADGMRWDRIGHLLELTPAQARKAYDD